MKRCQHDGGFFGASDGKNYCLKCDAIFEDLYQLFLTSIGTVPRD